MATRSGPAATYPIKFESNAKEVGEEGSSALEALRTSITKAQDTVKSYSDSLRKLRGDSDAVSKARDELKNKIKAEQTAITESTLKILKAGTSYDKLSEQHKKFRDEVSKGAAEKLKKQSEALSAAIEKVGGPAADLKNQIGGLSDMMSGASVAELGVVAAAAALVLAFVAVAAAIGAATLAFTKWMLVSANAQRNEELLREAMVGTEESAKNLGLHVDELAKKVPIARAELSRMGAELSLAGLGGQTLVDTLNAMGQAAGALGQGAGDQVKSFVERGRLSGRFSMGRLENVGGAGGVTQNDVAAALAKNLKVGLADATAALAEGRVALGDGAAALRTAMETRFGKLNLRKLLDLDVMKAKILETFDSFTKGIKLEPLLEAFGRLSKLFDDSTETGSALKDLVQGFGQGIVDAFTAAEPFVKGFVEGLISESLDLEDAWLTLRLQLQDTFGDSGVLDDIDGLTAGVNTGKIAVDALVVAIGAVAFLAAAWATPFVVVGGIIYGIYEAFKWINEEIGKGIDAIGSFLKKVEQVGEAIGGASAKVANSSTGKTVVGALKAVFLPGFAEGLEEVPYDNFGARLHKGERVLTRDEAQAYKRGGSSSSSASGGLGGVTIPVTIVLGDGKGGVDEEALARRVRAEIVRALEQVLTARGKLTPAPAGGSL
jgi:hypothetical protein